MFLKLTKIFVHSQDIKTVWEHASINKLYWYYKKIDVTEKRWGIYYILPLEMAGNLFSVELYVFFLFYCILLHFGLYSPNV